MNIVKVNAIGDNCPIPVVKAKKAIESLTGAAIVEINVDNEIAVQNVTKMVNQKNLESTCEKLGEKNYLIKVKCGEVVESQAEEEVVTTVEKEEKIVVALAASIMAGDGIPNPNLHIKRTSDLDEEITVAGYLFTSENIITSPNK